MNQPKRNLKRVYIAGPYRAETAFGIEQNIMNAKKWAAKFWERGIAVFCPHMNTANLDGVVPDQTFLDAGLDFLLDCDAVAVLPKYWKSHGTRAEIKFAEENKIPVYCLEEFFGEVSLDGIAREVKGLVSE